MLHRQINPSKMFASVFSGPDPENEGKISLPDNGELTRMLASLYQEEINRTIICANLPVHIDGTYAYREELKKSLFIIAFVLSTPEQMQKYNISPSIRDMMLFRLIEGIGNCTPGFMNRTQEILLEFKSPQSIEELLSDYRKQIVEDAFTHDEIRRSTRREVHTHNRFFVVAKSMGYGVPCVEDDPYRGEKYDSDIQRALKAEFSAAYTPLRITSTVLETPLRTLLGDRQVDEKEESVPDHWERISVFLKKILKNQDLSYYDLYRISTDGELSGLDWTKIRSSLIDMLLREEYLLVPEDDQMTSLPLGDGSLRIVYDKRDFQNALICFTADNQTYRSFLFADHNIAERLPKEYQHALATTLKNLLIKKYLHRSTLLFYLQGVSCTFGRNVPELLRVTLAKKAKFLIRNNDDFTMVFSQTLTTSQFDWLSDTFDFSSMLEKSVDTTADLFRVLQKIHRGRHSAFLQYKAPARLLTDLAQKPGFLNHIYHMFPREEALSIIESPAIKNQLTISINSWEVVHTEIYFLHTSEIRSFLASNTGHAVLAGINWRPENMFAFMTLLKRKKIHPLRDVPYMKVILWNYCDSAAALRDLLYAAPKQQRPEILAIVRDRLHRIIQSASDLAMILRHLPPASRMEVADIAKANPVELIQSYHELKLLFAYDIKGRLLMDWVGSGENFLRYLDECPPAKRTRFLCRLFNGHPTLTDAFRTRLQNNYPTGVSSPAFFTPQADLTTILEDINTEKAVLALMRVAAQYPRGVAALILRDIFVGEVSPPEQAYDSPTPATCRQ